MRIHTLASITSAIAALALFVGCATHQNMGAAVENDNNVLTGGPVTGTTLTDLPQGVKETLKQRAPTAEIADIDKKEKDGRVCYKISFAEPGSNPVMYIQQDGTVVTDFEKK